MSETNQREYFRIDDNLSIEFRPVGPDEFLRLSALIRYSPSYRTDKCSEMHFLSDVMSRTKGEENDLYTYLRLLDRKLDTIIDLLSSRNDGNAYKTVYGPVNISGSGIKFASGETLDIGERVEMRLSLPLAPFPKISILCEVLRTDESPKDEGKTWEIALKFLILNDDDRDFLVNYIFMKERERLRATKEDGF